MPLQANLMEFIYGARKPLHKMKVKEAKSELEVYRALFDWLGEEVKFYLARLGSTVRIVRRDFKPFLGELLTPHFTITRVEVACEDKVWDQNTGRWNWERKVVIIPVSNLIDFEFIQESWPAEPGEGEVSGQDRLLEEVEEPEEVKEI